LQEVSPFLLAKNSNFPILHPKLVALNYVLGKVLMIGIVFHMALIHN